MGTSSILGNIAELSDTVSMSFHSYQGIKEWGDKDAYISEQRLLIIKIVTEQLRSWIKAKKKLDSSTDYSHESITLKREESCNLDLKDLQIKLTDVKFGRSPVCKWDFES